MKNILGLDLGTTSIGWAFVKEAETSEEKSSIVKIGVRVNPLTVDEQTNFNKGKPITTNAERTLKRGARRNLQRYKLRRAYLINELRNAGLITDAAILTEQGPGSTFETLRLRAKSATDKVSLEEFARILLMINKKRGYKSSRKVNNDEDGQLIDGMTVRKPYMIIASLPDSMYINSSSPGKSIFRISTGQTCSPNLTRFGNARKSSTRRYLRMH